MEHNNFQNENLTLSNYGQLQVRRKPKVASTPKLSNSFLGLAPSYPTKCPRLSWVHCWAQTTVWTPIGSVIWACIWWLTHPKSHGNAWSADHLRALKKLHKIKTSIRYFGIWHSRRQHTRLNSKRFQIWVIRCLRV
jgi:hypothetical protein